MPRERNEDVICVRGTLGSFKRPDKKSRGKREKEGKIANEAGRDASGKGWVDRLYGRVRLLPFS